MGLRSLQGPMGALHPFAFFQNRGGCSRRHGLLRVLGRAEAAQGVHLQHLAQVLRYPEAWSEQLVLAHPCRLCLETEGESGDRSGH